MSKINLNRVSPIEFNMVRPFLKYPPEKVDALRMVLVDGLSLNTAEIENNIPSTVIGSYKITFLSRLWPLLQSFYLGGFFDDVKRRDDCAIRFFLADSMPEGVKPLVHDLSLFAFKSRVSAAHARTLSVNDFNQAKSLTRLSEKRAYEAVYDVFCNGKTLDAAGLNHDYGRQAVSLFCQNFMRTLSMLDDSFFALNDAVRDVVSDGGVLVVASLDKKDFLLANGLLRSK